MWGSLSIPGKSDPWPRQLFYLERNYTNHDTVCVHVLYMPGVYDPALKRAHF